MKEGRGLRRVRGFAEETPTERDDGVGGENHVVGIGGDDLGLGPGEAEGTDPRQLAPCGCLVDLGGNNDVGDDADLSEKLAAARAGRAEDQARTRIT